MAFAEDLGVFPSTQEGPKLAELLELTLNSSPSPCSSLPRAGLTGLPPVLGVEGSVCAKPVLYHLNCISHP